MTQAIIGEERRIPAVLEEDKPLLATKERGVVGWMKKKRIIFFGLSLKIASLSLKITSIRLRHDW